MTMRSPSWTRRQFSQTFAASALVSLVPAKALSAPFPSEKSFAFIGSSSTSNQTAAIRVFEATGSRWQPLQTLSCAAPAHLETHPTLPILYAVHDVSLWENLPRGAVSIYDIAPTGLLTHRNTQPLSLSATHPRHAAVSPDGRSLLVASARGGLYNLLPIAADGSLEPPSAIRKELGLLEGPAAKLASPHQVVFHPDGSTLLTADSGQQSIALFEIGQESIWLRHRLRTHLEAGPSQIALSPSGDWLYAQHAANGSIAAHQVTRAEVHRPIRGYLSKQPGPAHMVLHPSGRFLVTGNDTSLTTLTPGLSATASMRLRDHLHLLTFAPGGTHLLGAGKSSGEILQLDFNPVTGALSQPQPVAQVNAAISLLVRLA